MNQSDPLELVDPGSLTRPGPVGRLFRCALGALCLFALWDIAQGSMTTFTQPFSALGGLVPLLIAPLCVFNYVVNIGFSRSWGRRPLIASLLVLALATAFGLFGIALVVWLCYFYGHLGVSFVVSAVIATPGCEMRSIPELVGRARGIPSAEHHCPALFIARIDDWERRRFLRG